MYTNFYPNKKGVFPFYLYQDIKSQGWYYWFENEIPIAFAIKSDLKGISDIAEFYVISICRHQGIGQKLAFSLFDLYPGSWQVRQILEATSAQHFWRKVIHTYTQGEYQERIVEDPDWGKVVRQTFIATKKPK